MRKDSTGKRISAGIMGLSFLTLVIGLLLAVAPAQAATKPVKSVTIKAGECYDIILTKKCTGFQDTRVAILTPKQEGTVYDAVFYSGSAGNGSIMQIDAEKKQKLGIMYLCGGYYPVGYDRDSGKDPSKQLCATIQVKSGSLTFRMTGFEDKKVSFITKKVSHKAFKTILVKKGTTKEYYLGTGKEYAATCIEAVFKARKGTTLTFAGKRWKQTVKFNSKKALATDLQYDKKGKEISRYTYEWSYSKKKGDYRYLQYMNVTSFGDVSTDKPVYMIVPYVMQIKSKTKS